MRAPKRTRSLTGLFLVFLTSIALAGGHSGGGKKEKKIGQYSGYEGQEEVLGEIMVEVLNDAGAKIGKDYDFSGREKEVGLFASKMIKTLIHNSAYRHEMSDALVKQGLEFMQYAKDTGNLEEVARKDAMTQFPMLKRVGSIIEKNGKKELALVAITDQTTCFFQLVGEVERGTGWVRYKAPYGHVLEQTSRLGMHDLTEEEIHEGWTKPHIEVWSEVMGVEITVSDWQEDGMVTLTVPDVAGTMAAN